MANKSYYNTILSQVFSPCGSYLIVGDIYGYIYIFNLNRIINPETKVTTQDRKPKNAFLVQYNVQINSLLATDNYLLVGTVGEISGYNWGHIKNSKDVKPTWKTEIPNTSETFEKVDVNCMVYDEQSGVIIAGCGDNKIYLINAETREIVSKLIEHVNFIHSIANLGNVLISGGEDGLVCMWDVRMKKAVHMLAPYTNSKIHRPELGKWIGAVALNDDWLLCGGGPRLSLWHYRSLNVSTIFPLDDRGIHVAEFHQDKILAGGRSKYFHHMNLNGDLISEIPNSSVSIYSAIHQDEPYKALCLSGSSSNIDICSNFNYRDQVLSVTTPFDTNK